MPGSRKLILALWGVVLLLVGLAPSAAGASLTLDYQYDEVGFDYDKGIDASGGAADFVVGPSIGGQAGPAASDGALERRSESPGGVNAVYLRTGLSHNAPQSVPRSFGSAGDFGSFGDDLYGGLRRAGYDDVTAVFQGSSVTGQSFHTGVPFDVGRVSDFDIALTSTQVLSSADALGIGLRSGGTRTGPLTAAQLQRLGLGDLATSLGETAGRPANFMIYDSVAGATGRSPSIAVPR